MATATKARVAGVWQTMSTVKARVAGVWQACSVKARVAGVWQLVHSALSCVINSNGDSNIRLNNPCYAGIRLLNTGIEYEYTNSAGSTNIGNWLVAGTAAEVWAYMTVSSGSWNSLNAGINTRLQLSTGRSWRIVQSSVGVRSITCRVRLNLSLIHI